MGGLQVEEADKGDVYSRGEVGRALRDEMSDLSTRG